jgi:hypothetical protein
VEIEGATASYIDHDDMKEGNKDEEKIKETKDRDGRRTERKEPNKRKKKQK